MGELDYAAEFPDLQQEEEPRNARSTKGSLMFVTWKVPLLRRSSAVTTIEEAIEQAQQRLAENSNERNFSVNDNRSNKVYILQVVKVVTVAPPPTIVRDPDPAKDL